MSPDRDDVASGQSVTPESLAAALFPGDAVEVAGVQNAIRTELLRWALDDPEQPATVDELLRVLRRLAPRGEVACQLRVVVGEFALREPELTLVELAYRR